MSEDQILDFCRLSEQIVIIIFLLLFFVKITGLFSVKIISERKMNLAGNGLGVQGSFLSMSDYRAGLKLDFMGWENLALNSNG